MTIKNDSKLKSLNNISFMNIVENNWCWISAWTMAIVPPETIGKAIADGGIGTKVFAIVLSAGIAAGTTPLQLYIMDWKTPHARVGDIAIAIGTAQTMDGLVHLFIPNFYNEDRHTAVMCSANIFFLAGLLGIFSAYM
jgi:hypothetical protein